MKQTRYRVSVLATVAYEVVVNAADQQEAVEFVRNTFNNREKWDEVQFRVLDTDEIAVEELDD
jgi:hypothetical protein